MVLLCAQCEPVASIVVAVCFGGLYYLLCGVTLGGPPELHNVLDSKLAMPVRVQPFGPDDEKQAHASSCFAISRGVQNACIACLCGEVAEALPCVAMASLMPVSRCCCALL